MISDVEASLLGLLCEAPKYGYEIEKLILDRNMRVWTDIAFSSIYYVLKKLEAKGLITSRLEAVEGKPSRRIYSMTPEGLQELRERLKWMISVYHRVTSPFDIGLAYLSFLDEKDVRECLVLYRKSIDEQIAFNHWQLESIKRRVNWPWFIEGLATKPLAHLDAEKRWLDEFIEEFEKHNAIKGEKED